MKKTSIRPILVAVLMTLAPAFAAAIPAAAAEEKEAAVTIPATAAEIWQAIDMHVKELHADIDKGALKNVHAHAFAVRDLVRGLPTHSPGLSVDANAKVKDQVTFVDTLAGRLDKTGDANDKPGTVSNLTKLEGVLKTIRANYPPA